ncbi:MAG: phage major capsid domain-containing protein [Candidatus Fonsibacter sp.]
MFITWRFQVWRQSLAERCSGISTVTLKITTENRPVGTYACNYGVTDALAPFPPLHSLVNVMSATTNNNSVL